MANQQQVANVRKVALIGGAGSVGTYILKHLLAIGQHTITVLTRTESTTSFPSHANLTVAKVDYSSETSLVEILTGHDSLIITLSARAPPNLHSTIIAAASTANIPWVIPNYFGYGVGARAGGLTTDPLLGKFGQTIDDVTAHPSLSYVVLVCGFWYEFSLGMGEQWLGFDIDKRGVVMYGDGQTKVNTSTWEQCGRSVASLLSLPVQGAQGPVVSDWKNNGIYVSSFLISQRDILESLHRVLGTTDTDWNVSYQDVEERYKEGMEEMQAGNFLGFAKAMYARLFYPSGEGNYEMIGGLDNEKLGLPKEDLDEATKRAVEMVKGGFGIHA